MRRLRSSAIGLNSIQKAITGRFVVNIALEIHTQNRLDNL